MKSGILKSGHDSESKNMCILYLNKFCCQNGEMNLNLFPSHSSASLFNPPMVSFGTHPLVSQDLRSDGDPDGAAHPHCHSQLHDRHGSQPGFP